MSAASPAEGARPLRALVVEDEWPARNYLVELLEGSGLAEVVAAVAGLEDARQALAPGGVVTDVAFVDVRLVGSPDDQAGLTLVREAAAQADAPLFVLTTAFPEHAVEAYALGVVDYLLKPFSEERVERCLRRLLARRPAPARPASPRRVVARRRTSLVFLELPEVFAFEAAERLSFVHAASGRYELDLSLAALEAAFGAALLRVHRNWLVNTARVRVIEREDGELVLRVGGQGADALRVPVARDRAAQVREALLASAAGLRRG